MAAADKANSGSAAVTYQVSYGVCLLFDTARSLKTGSTIPVKLQVGDAGGANTSSSAVLVTAQGISLVSTSVSEPLQDAGNANPDNNFRFDAPQGVHLQPEHQRLRSRHLRPPLHRHRRSGRASGPVPIAAGAESGDLVPASLYAGHWPEPLALMRMIRDGRWATQPIADAWGPFFPDVQRGERDTYLYPVPESDAFWAAYSEPVGWLLGAASVLRGAVLDLSADLVLGGESTWTTCTASTPPCALCTVCLHRYSLP